MNRALLQAAAQAAHESNRAFSLARGQHSVPHWEQLPEAEKHILDLAVQRVSEGCSARELHAAWVHDKKQSGWRPGERRDVMGKEHPSLVDWEELPPVERDRDQLFVTVVRAMLSAFPLNLRLAGTSAQPTTTWKVPARK